MTVCQLRKIKNLWRTGRATSVSDRIKAGTAFDSNSLTDLLWRTKSLAGARLVCRSSGSQSNQLVSPFCSYSLERHIKCDLYWQNFPQRQWIIHCERGVLTYSRTSPFIPFSHGQQSLSLEHEHHFSKFCDQTVQRSPDGKIPICRKVPLKRKAPCSWTPLNISCAAWKLQHDVNMQIACLKAETNVFQVWCVLFQTGFFFTNSKFAIVTAHIRKQVLSI